MFFSTFEKPMDAKRRIVLPQEFRAAATGEDGSGAGAEGGFDGVFCFPSIEADCLEGGGRALFDAYRGLIGELPLGDRLRSALEIGIFGGLHRLAFDTAGRITLPESLCEQFGLAEAVAVVGLGDRFQIWSREAFRAHRAEQARIAREDLAAYRASQRRGTAA